MRMHMVTDLKTGETRVEPMKATNDVDARAELEALVHDCPECQAALARGETPTFYDGSELMTMSRRPKSTDRFRRPRWRDLRRRVRKV